MLFFLSLFLLVLFFNIKLFPIQFQIVIKQSSYFPSIHKLLLFLLLKLSHQFLIALTQLQCLNTFSLIQYLPSVALTTSDTLLQCSNNLISQYLCLIRSNFLILIHTFIPSHLCHLIFDSDRCSHQALVVCQDGLLHFE